MRDAFIHRQLQHLRIDQQQAHLLRRGLVQQAQDHRVDRHRFARTGGARHQHMRHLGQIGDHRFAGNILAHRDGQRGAHIGIHLRAEYLGQAHHLAFRIGQLQRHVCLAGYRFDQAYAHHRQCARQILHQIGDLAALHADGGFDLVARDHRPGIGRHHFHFHAEILQLALDQARGEFQRVGRNDFDLLRGLIQQMQRRQRRIRHIGEQRHLFFLHGPRRFDHFHQRHFDVYGLVILDALLFFFDDGDSLMRRLHADTPILARLPGQARPQISGFQQFAQPVHKAQPGQSAEHAEAGGDQGQQQQRRAGKSKHTRQRFAQHRAEHSARCQRQRDFQCCTGGSLRARCWQATTPQTRRPRPSNVRLLKMLSARRLWYPAHTRCSMNSTHHQAEKPNR